MKKPKPKPLTQYVVAGVWQKKKGNEISQYLLMYGVKAANEQAAIELAEPLAQAELASWGETGYERKMGNAATINF